MKPILILFFFLSCLATNAQDPTFHKNIDTAQCELQMLVDTNSNSFRCTFQINDEQSSTLFFNKIFTIIYILTAIIGLLTLVGAIAGVISWTNVNRIRKKINRIFEDNKNRDEMLKYFNNKILYSNKLSDNLFRVLTNPKDKKTALEIFIQIQESKLFSINEQDRLTALQHLSINGTNENLESIKFIADNDESEEVRKFANQVIGIIQTRSS